MPVYHSGQVAGVLELRFARANSFRESDLRAAELMAGLLSEAMVTAARMKWKEALASERQSMLEALERIKPQLERLGDSIAARGMRPQAKPAGMAPRMEPRAASPLRPRIASTCAACGSEFFDDSESFCGICGTARTIAPKLAPSRSDSHPWLAPTVCGRKIPRTEIRTARKQGRQPGSPAARETLPCPSLRSNG